MYFNPERHIGESEPQDGMVQIDPIHVGQYHAFEVGNSEDGWLIFNGELKEVTP